MNEIKNSEQKTDHVPNFIFQFLIMFGLGIYIFISQFGKTVGNIGIAVSVLIYFVLLGPKVLSKVRNNEKIKQAFFKTYRLTLQNLLIALLILNAIIELDEWLHFAGPVSNFIKTNGLGVFTALLFFCLGLSGIFYFSRK